MMGVYILLLAVISFTFPGMVQQQECGTETFPRRERFRLDEAIDYQLPNTTVFIGYLFIAPELKFDCHGSITSWHALTYFNTADAALDVIFNDITFQLWRRSTEDNKVYSFIGSNIAQFQGNEIRNRRIILEDGTQFFNLTSAPLTQERLQFQPGDVIGWYIHTGVQASNQPLSIVYSSHATSDENAVDLYSTEITDSNYAATPPPCDVAICSTNTTLIPSVIPYITVEYETLSNPQEIGRIGPHLCVNNSSPLGLVNCHLIPNAPESTPPDPHQTKSITNSETVSPQSKNSDVPILIAVITVVVIMFISATLLGVTVVLLYCRRSRNSTNQNTRNTNEAAVHTSTVTVDLTRNDDAYGVTTETQRNREAVSVVMSENTAYGAAPLSGLNQYEII